jgi:histidinol-phosphate/aromatic aminotransferase/cobyric acid decarboxylase-like protein
VEKEQRIIDLEQELKEVREAAAAEKKRLEDELTEEKRKAVEATAQFHIVSTGRPNLHVGDLVEGGSFGRMLNVIPCRVPQP